MAGLFFESGIDDGFEQDLVRMKKQVGSLSSSVQSEGEQMNSTFKMVGAGLATYFSGVQLFSFARSVTETRAEFQKFGVVLENTLGSKVDADNALAMVADFAANTPFQLNELTDSFIKLTNQGFQPTREEMVKMGDLASSTGKGFQQLTEAILDAQTGEFERLKEFGIKARKEGDNVTFTFKGQETQVQNTADAIRGYVLSLGNLEGVLGANAAISASLTGQISNLGDAWDAMLNDIGKGQEGVISDALSGAKYLVDNYKEVVKVLGSLVAAYGAYKISVIAVNQQRKIAASLEDVGSAASGKFLAEKLSFQEQEALGITNINNLTREQIAIINQKVVSDLEDLKIQLQKQKIILQTVAVEGRAAKENLVNLQKKVQVEKASLSSAIKNQDLTAARIAQERLANLEDKKAIATQAVKAATLNGQTSALKINAIQTQINTVQTNLGAAADKGAAVGKNLLTKATFGLGKGLNSLKLAFASNPVGIIVTALSLAIPLFMDFNDEQEAAVDAGKSFAESIAEGTSEMTLLFSQLKQTNKGTDTRSELIKEINEKYGEYLPKLLTEKSSLFEIERAQSAANEALINNIALKAQNSESSTILQAQIKREQEAFAELSESTGVSIASISAAYRDLLASSFDGTGNLGDLSSFFALHKSFTQISSNESRIISQLTSARERDAVALKKVSDNYSIYITKKKQDVSPDKGSGGKGKDKKDKKVEEELSYYEKLKKALEDAEEALLNLSGEESSINKTAIAEQLSKIEALKTQIKKQEELLGLTEKTKDEKIKEREVEEGSIKSLEKKLTVAKENFDYATSQTARNGYAAEIKEIEKEIVLLQGVGKEGIKIKDIQTLSISQLQEIAEKLKGQIKLQKLLNIDTSVQEKAYATVANTITKKIGEATVDWADGLSAVGSAVGQIDERVGRTISDIATLAASVGQAIIGVASGNPIEVVKGVANFVGKIFEIGKRIKARKEAEKQEAIERRTEAILSKQTADLEAQEKVLGESIGTDRFDAYKKTLETIQAQIQEIDRTSADAVNFEELEKRRAELIDKYTSLLKDSYSELTGTTSSSITDSIVKGFEDGMFAVEDFTGTFEDLMKDALLKSFSAKFLEAQFQDFYGAFAQAVESENQLTPAEIVKLREQFNANIRTAQEGYASFNDLFKDSFVGGFGGSAIGTQNDNNQPTMQAQQIQQQISAESESVLLGRLGAIMVSNQEMVNQGLDALDYAMQNLVYMKQIKINTDYLPEIAENTRKTYQKLEAI